VLTNVAVVVMRLVGLAPASVEPHTWPLAVGELDASDVRLPRRVLTPHVRMTEKDLVGELRVTVENGTITVTMPGTNYSVTYRNGDDPSLVRSDIRDDPDYPSHRFTFRARALTAANDKAHELGWIV